MKWKSTNGLLRIPFSLFSLFYVSWQHNCVGLSPPLTNFQLQVLWRIQRISWRKQNTLFLLLASEIPARPHGLLLSLPADKTLCYTSAFLQLARKEWGSAQWLCNSAFVYPDGFSVAEVIRMMNAFSAKDRIHFLGCITWLFLLRSFLWASGQLSHISDAFWYSAEVVCKLGSAGEEWERKRRELPEANQGVNMSPLQP